jgi:iron(III) transport system permease protein
VPGRFADVRPGVWLAGALVLAFLLLFLVLPVGARVLHRLRRGRRHADAGPLRAFFSQGLMKEAFFNSLTWRCCRRCSPR